MILFVFVRTCLQFLAKTLYEIVSQGVLQKVRNELFERIQNQDMHFFDTHTKGDLVTRLTGDLDMIRHSIAWIIMMVVESSALFLFTVIYFFTLDWLMTLFILALTPIQFIVTRMFSKRVGPKYVLLREKLSGTLGCTDACRRYLCHKRQDNHSSVHRILRTVMDNSKRYEKYRYADKRFTAFLCKYIKDNRYILCTSAYRE